MFVKMVSLPRTVTGKIDRRAWPSTEQARATARRIYVEPKTPIEAALAAIWSQALNLEKIGIEEKFFEPGGHSLLATQVVSRLRQVLGVELEVRALFEQPMVRGLGQAIKQSKSPEITMRTSSPIEARRPEELEELSDQEIDDLLQELSEEMQ